MTSDIITRATEYWSGKRRGRRLPARPVIDPVELGEMLPHLVIAEAIDDGADYHHRIAGDAAETLLGAGLHGARLSDIEKDCLLTPAWRQGLDQARAFKAPHFAAFDGKDGAPALRAVFLPLSRDENDEEDADFIMSAIITDEVTAA